MAQRLFIVLTCIRVIVLVRFKFGDVGVDMTNDNRFLSKGEKKRKNNTEVPHVKGKVVVEKCV